MKLLISNDNLSSLKFFANLGKLIEYSLMFVKKMYISRGVKANAHLEEGIII